MLKLKLQYFGHLMQRTDSLGKTLMLGKIEGRKRRGCQRMQWLDGITDAMDMNLGKPQEGSGKPGVCGPWGHKELDMTEQQLLAWRIPWTEEPGGLQSVGSERVRHSGSNLACAHAMTKQ